MVMRVWWSMRRVAESPGPTSSSHSTLPPNGGCHVRNSTNILSTPLASSLRLDSTLHICHGGVEQPPHGTRIVFEGFMKTPKKQHVLRCSS